MRIEPIVTILSVALVANLALIVGLVGYEIARRRSSPRPNVGQAGTQGPQAMPGPASATPPTGVGAMPPGTWSSPLIMEQEPEGPMPRRFPVVYQEEDPRAHRTIESFLTSTAEGREPAPDGSTARPRSAEPTPPAGAAPADPLVDSATGLESAFAWERAIRDESARHNRYRRPVAVVFAELEGLQRLTERFGPEPAKRLVPAVGDALHSLARETDKVAHLGNGRFGVLLPETDEIQAINYVERVRGACDRWLEAGAVALRLALGWASPAHGVSLESAIRTAEDRLYAERRKFARSADNE